MSAPTVSHFDWPPPFTSLPDGAGRDEWLLALCEHQRRRWLAGDAVPSEAYFQRYPELRNDPLAVFRLGVNEAVLSRETGRAPATDDCSAGARQETDTFPRSATPGPTAETLLPSPSASHEGQLEFPGYEVVERLGGGGMGVVYKAVDSRLGRLVAIKVVRHTADPGQLRRFAVEARAMARLDHPNIVPIHGAGDHRGSPYLVLKYLPGGTLAGRVVAGGASPTWAAGITEKVARAVDYLHSQKVLHRDLKPANILLDERGEPFVADFGIAKLVEGGTELTWAGAVLGTMAYMPPEQVKGELHRMGPASEVWSLGVVLYELLAGRKPFTQGDREALAAAIISQEPPPLRSLRPSLCAGLEAVVLRCLRKLPEERYASAGELAGALRSWLDGAPPPEARRIHRRAALGAMGASALALGGATAAMAGGAVVPRKALPRPSPAGKRPGLKAPLVWPLLSPAGAPLRPHWAAGQARGSFAAQPAGALTARSDDIGLLDLAPGPPCSAYRLEVELCHEAGKEAVGVYVARQVFPDLDGDRHVFLLLSLCESRGQVTGHAALLLASYHTAQTGTWWPALISQLPIHPRPLQAAPPLRRLVLEVGRAGCRASLDGKVVATASPGGLVAATRRIKAHAWAPGHGAIGAYLRKSTARFTSARLVEAT